MADKEPFGGEFDLVKRALGDTFTGRVLAWQLGGTMVAALIAFLLVALPNAARGVQFVLTGLAFILGYVVLAATGCIIMRTLAGSGEERASGTAALHFLVDNIGPALLLPLLASAAGVVLAGILCGPAALWCYDAWQAILVIPSILVFVLAALVVADLFVLLFIVPAMVASEQPPLGDAMRRLWRLFWGRKMELFKVFAVGVVVAVALALPLWLLASKAVDVTAWVYGAVAGPSYYLRSFPRFVLRLASWLLFWAPIVTLPLAFLNALAANAYDELVEGLEAEEEEEEPEEEVPSGGEEVDLEVAEEEPAAKPKKPAKPKKSNE